MRQHLSRRRFIELTVPAGAAALSGCIGGDGNGDGDGDGSGGGTTSDGSSGDQNWVFNEVEQVDNPDSITAWNLGSIEGNRALQQLYEGFAEDTGVEVNVREIPPGDVLSRARSQIQAQSAEVDVWFGDWPFVWDLGADGALEDLSAFISDENFEGWPTGAKKSAQMPIDSPDFDDFPYPEGIYAAPFFVSAWMVWTNKDVMEAAGFERNAHPETFTEFRQMAEQISDVDGVDFPVQFPFTGFISGLPIVYDLTVRSGGHFFQDGSPDFENEGFVEALDFLLGLVNDGLASQGVTSLTEEQAMSNFWDGGTGLQIMVAQNFRVGSEALPSDRSANDVAQINLYPTPDGIGFNETPTGNFFEVLGMLPVYSNKKEPAAKLLASIASKEWQADMLGIRGTTPIRPDVFETDIVQENWPEDYRETLSQHLAGIDKLTHQQPARVADSLLTHMHEAMASGRGAEATASRIQSEVEQYAQ